MLGRPPPAPPPTAGGGGRPAPPPQRRLAALAPAAIPDAGGLRRHPEGVGDLGLAGALGEHVGGFQAALLQAGEVAPPGAHLDRHRRPPCAVPVPSYPACRSQIALSTYSAKLFSCWQIAGGSGSRTRRQGREFSLSEGASLRTRGPSRRAPRASTRPEQRGSA